MTTFGDYTPELAREGESPLFVRIARAIAADIRRGRLASRARLPGSRELGKRLGAHRNTVLSAYAELEQEGWIVSERARGTFVADALPERTPRRFKAPDCARSSSRRSLGRRCRRASRRARFRCSAVCRIRG